MQESPDTVNDLEQTVADLKVRDRRSDDTIQFTRKDFLLKAGLSGAVIGLGGFLGGLFAGNAIGRRGTGALSEALTDTGLNLALTRIELSLKTEAHRFGVADRVSIARGQSEDTIHIGPRSNREQIDFSINITANMAEDRLIQLSLTEHIKGQTAAIDPFAPANKVNSPVFVTRAIAMLYSENESIRVEGRLALEALYAWSKLQS